ncbi:MAG: NTP transferase domain-containing protein [Ignavibacteriales bacterium]|nr:NTP transferase domain-containing protein [Ignavibacteriales bacterium]
MKETNIVILAGGISSRMRKSDQSSVEIDPTLLTETRTKSKSMLSVGESARPFLDYVLFNIEQAGYRDVVIVVGENDPTIFQYYEQKGGKAQFKQLAISYATQKIPEGRTKPLGTADALLEALRSRPDWKGQSFTICNSDNIYSVRALKLLMEDDHENAMIDYDRSALQFERSRIEAFSVIRKDKDGFLLDIVEKPSPTEIEKAKDANGRIGVSMNIFRFSYDMVFPFLEAVPLHPIRHEKELPTAVNVMIKEYPHSLYTIPLAEHVIDLTSLSDIKNVQEYLRNEFPTFTNPK